MAQNCPRNIRTTLFAGVLFWSSTFVNAQFSHCCDISKCLLVEKACRSADLVNGTSCTDSCLSRGQFNCKPANLDSLATYDYSCFEPFIVDAANQPLQKICGQTYRSGTDPAPALDITHTECMKNCGGWAVAKWPDPQAWATPLVQYILPGTKIIPSVTT